MKFLSEHILSLIIFSPLLGIFLISLVPRKFEEGVRAIALFTSLLTFALTCYLWANFANPVGYSFQEIIPWVPSFHINYHLGIDGVSLLMIALTSLLVPLCVAVSWNEIKTRRKEFYVLLLACQIGLAGTFASLDLFLFYVFWEVMLIPMYFLIGIFGSGRKIYVALKFLLYTMLGSLVMLVGIIYLYLASNNSFDITKIGFGPGFHTIAQVWLFASFALAFAIKVPIVPFHTWLPDAHTESPTAGSVLLAGVFLKAGAYGFYRLAMPFFPDAVAILRPYIFVLAIVGIIYGALLSMAQKDLKRLIAYSSVSHLGFVVLGLISLNPEGVQGAILQMINHGISTGALFLLFGMLYLRTHTRDIKNLNGIASVMPLFAGLFVFTGVASMGLPGLNNFVGEILILFGSFKSYPVFAIIAATCMVFTAVYILWAIQRVFFGKISEHAKDVKDMDGREFALMLPLVILMIVLGVYPKFALNKIADSADSFIQVAKASIHEVTGSRDDVIVPERRRLPEPEIIIPPEAVDRLNDDMAPEPEPGKYSDDIAHDEVDLGTPAPVPQMDVEPGNEMQKEGALPLEQ